MKWLRSSNNYVLSPEAGSILQSKICEPINPGLHTTLLFKLIVLYFSWTIFISIIIYYTSIILELLLRTNTFINFLKLTGGKPLLKKVQAHAKQNKTNQESPQIKPTDKKNPKPHYIKKPQTKTTTTKKSHLTWSQLYK